MKTAIAANMASGLAQRLLLSLALSVSVGIQAPVSADDTPAKAADAQNVLKPGAVWLRYLQTLRRGKTTDDIKTFFVDDQPFRGSIASTMADAPRDSKNSKPTARERFLLGKMYENGLNDPQIISEKIEGLSATIQVACKAALEHLSPSELNELSTSSAYAETLKKAGLKSTKPSGIPRGTVTFKLVNGLWKIDTQEWSAETSGGEMSFSTVQHKSSTWCADAAKSSFPRKPAYGMVHGLPVLIRQATFSKFNSNLILSSGKDPAFTDPSVTLSFFSLPITELEGKSFNQNSENAPWAELNWKGAGKFLQHKNYTKMDGYGINLQFGKITNNMLPGYIVLRFPDAEKSYVEGYFYAAIK